jgi:hypothetical protein
MVQLIPELATKFFIGISDKEFTPVMDKNFKNAFIAICENHVVQDIER